MMTWRELVRYVAHSDGLRDRQRLLGSADPDRPNETAHPKELLALGSARFHLH